MALFFIWLYGLYGAAVPGKILHREAAQILADDPVQTFPEGKRPAGIRTGAGTGALLETGYGNQIPFRAAQNVQDIHVRVEIIIAEILLLL